MAKEKDILVRLGENLQKRAKSKYKSNVELADASNVAESTIRRIFSGDQNVSLKLLKQVCDALDIKPSEILKEIGS